MLERLASSSKTSILKQHDYLLFNKAYLKVNVAARFRTAVLTSCIG
ncbi:hypothetical protein ACZ87_02521 [Candidatus Erwinia dacicola]|uniref:Uncharacterized protein n=1 Tax=Candidatus Erwinia dacicola TaxID=252393 RepID=A0A328TSF2_9GAMM|nr:hypothetical protein ACZ87_02521 [Candidatus Erwinia dacicola]